MALPSLVIQFLPLQYALS